MPAEQVQHDGQKCTQGKAIIGNEVGILASLLYFARMRYQSSSCLETKLFGSLAPAVGTAA